jgi:hypothetical protein
MVRLIELFPVRPVQWGSMRQVLPYGLCALILLAFPGLSHGQMQIYTPYQNVQIWRADTLFIGATFLRMSDKPVTIWSGVNLGDWEGLLSFMDPSTGRPIPILSNKAPTGQVINLSDIVDIPVGSSLTFMYQVRDQMGDVRGTTTPKYTGPNQPGDTYFSEASSDSNITPSFRFGHRWAVLGNVNDSVIQFGFEDEDARTSDMDFDDVIFFVRGLEIGGFKRTLVRRSYLW